MTRGAPRLFGTDGIRGPAGEGPLAPEALIALGRAVAAAVRAGRPAGASPPRALLGRDTRPSGPLVAGALAAGLRSGGVAVEDGGVLPTPAVALLVRRGRLGLGVSVSASHNPAADNGVKLLGPDGEKVPETLERAVEAGLAAARRRRGAPPGAPAQGRLRPGAAEEYLDAVLEEFRGLSLRGMRVVVDGADGAACRTAPEAFRRLGAEVREVRCGGDGARINEGCGALHPESAGRAVRRHRARLGVALDGDGDRLALLDERGQPRDGDDLLAAVAPRLKSRGRLPGDAVVGTVMANGGLDAHLRRLGISLLRVPVGDRFVAAAMRERGLALGAEPSGHFLVPRAGGLLTADGLVSALWVAREMAATGRALSDLLRGFARVPRAEAAVPVRRKPPLARVAAVRRAIREAEATAGPGGRVLVRYSGTEPMVRILVEAPTRAAAERACAAVAAAAAEALG
jgi:phosphoglucosamine mutase